jgi:hypothetical protein
MMAASPGGAPLMVPVPAPQPAEPQAVLQVVVVELEVSERLHEPVAGPPQPHCSRRARELRRRRVARHAHHGAATCGYAPALCRRSAVLGRR